jgi:hypothetical protein
MKWILLVTVAVLLTTCSVHSASAQSKLIALTNADVIRLLAMRVSDQTVIAVIKETSVTQFDLSAPAVTDLAVNGVSTAVIAAMHQSSSASSPAVAPPAGPQTLAEAAAEAAITVHSWPLSTTTVSSSHTVIPHRPAAAPAETKAEPAVKDTSNKAATERSDTSVKDESYWRARVAPLNQQIHDNAGKSLTLKGRIDDLTTELLGIGPLNARRGVVETERQRLITEVQALNEAVSADIKAVKAIEEEGRVAGALPGWFRN